MIFKMRENIDPVQSGDFISLHVSSSHFFNVHTGLSYSYSSVQLEEMYDSNRMRSTRDTLKITPYEETRGKDVEIFNCAGADVSPKRV